VREVTKGPRPCSRRRPERVRRRQAQAGATLIQGEQRELAKRPERGMSEIRNPIVERFYEPLGGGWPATIDVQVRRPLTWQGEEVGSLQFFAGAVEVPDERALESLIEEIEEGIMRYKEGR
jgi:hypothetical protein